MPRAAGRHSSGRPIGGMDGLSSHRQPPLEVRAADTHALSISPRKPVPTRKILDLQRIAQKRTLLYSDVYFRVNSLSYRPAKP